MFNDSLYYSLEMKDGQWITFIEETFSKILHLENVCLDKPQSTGPNRNQ